MCIIIIHIKIYIYKNIIFHYIILNYNNIIENFTPLIRIALNQNNELMKT